MIYKNLTNCSQLCDYGPMHLEPNSAFMKSSEISFDEYISDLNCLHFGVFLLRKGESCFLHCGNLGTKSIGLSYNTCC